ncbi:MAG: S8 family serine peptidase [Candidatus Aminicenantes bacterium]|nr:S8 family serine peptidase [Candidatus Aminicenantes bacterium]
MHATRHALRFRRAWMISLAVVSAALLFKPGTARLQEPPQPPAMDLSPSMLPVRESHPKMQTALARLAAIEEREGSEAAAAFAQRRRMTWSDGGVRVITETVTGEMAGAAGTIVPQVSGHIQALGGTIQTSHRNRIQHILPAAALKALAADPQVAYIRLPLRPFKQAVISEGVSKTGADKWRDLAAFRNGTPAKIAILDLGFMGYSSLLGKELPAKVTTRSFRADGDLSAFEDHGAACAEIVYDMAPNAELYLVNIDTDVEQSQAVEWLNSKKVDVISYSLGWFNAGAGDGSGPIDADVAASNAQWAVSAGNGALDHWDGLFNDPDADGLLNFSGSDELLDFYVPAYETVGAFLNWKDWGVYNGYDYPGSNQDYDLYLYIWNGSSYQFVDSSTNDQTGSQWPTEEVYGWYSTTSTYWAVAIHKHSANRSLKLELFIVGNSKAIEYNVPARSISIPADSPDALTAGATDAVSDLYHSYSAQGPTHDGRMKPDLGSPSGVSTSTYGPDNFYGTSASAPHLAGALGLIKGGTPYTMAQIISILKTRAVDLGDPGPDYKFGYGRLNVKKR